MGVIQCGVERNGCNSLLWNGIVLITSGVDRNGFNRLWCVTESL
jgi:hypothetical protein